MSKLNIDQQTIKELFSNKKSDFLIPDYQRPYAWEETECQTLWDDIFTFAFPENDYSLFKSDEDEYFLGPIVTFKNADGKLEIIDGQQRLTTLMLMLRAFYSKFGNMKDTNSISTSDDIAKCIWKTDEFGNPDKNKLKIDSEVSSDDDKEEFLSILKSGETVAEQKSRYAKTYRFFQDKINEFLQTFPTYFAYLPTRILNNCILLPIEAESQDTALRIFSTLNDRGKPLSDTDIFKAQFYKFYSDMGRKDEFIQRWKDLETKCEDIFAAPSGSPMDELFTRYMYFERAKQGNKQTTTEALRKFYEKDKYAILKREETLSDLEDLVDFWKCIVTQDDTAFSDRVLRRLAVLNYAPNGMWTYLVSVYFMKNKNSEKLLDENDFYVFLDRITAFIWTYAVMRPGVNALRTPTYPAMIDIVNGRTVTFSDFLFSPDAVRKMLENYEFTNQRPITKSMLAWWAYSDDKQSLISLDTTLEIEHIFSRQRQINEKTLKDKNNLESLGNKALLEKGINIRASDYRFADKRKYYLGFTNDKGKEKAGTKVFELNNMAQSKDDFQETDIISRKEEILNGFLRYLDKNHLLTSQD
ncbi:DUF262 domain-containing protein [Butyrivibrio sp. INlla16]|uniref:DUF262 domain-containing protein n=1 Tax=Butyrivibrio sp. INlla16 TaxID=1520807 RepID=UPI0008863DFB|nr:DUF262 domain-containing protein [Butyrivibrio sp. INlla16]SDB49925.1 Protein of unknown function [Butyrivibrio sp. INlla16]